MMETGKKLNFYRLGLKEGKTRRMELTESYRLTGQGSGAFLYLAPVYDSMDLKGTWHRLVLEGTFRNCKYEIFAAAADTDLSAAVEQLWEEGRSPEEAFGDWKSVRRVNTPDLLLHDLEGRYLWILIRVLGAGSDSSFTIEGFRVEFPWRSFVEYLPEIYQEEGRGSFFERYLCGFQSLYEELEERVERLPEYLDYESTPAENLPLFADWTGNRAAGREYTPEQLRILLGRMGELETGRGTGRVLLGMLKFVTGRDAVLVEYFKWHDWMSWNREPLQLYQRLYGKNDDTFTVILDTTGEEQPDRSRLERLMKELTPLGLECNLVLLNWSSHMDTHCYLDRNSRLSRPEQAGAAGFVLDDRYMLG